jgi:hypothetical protein
MKEVLLSTDALKCIGFLTAYYEFVKERLHFKIYLMRNTAHVP